MQFLFDSLTCRPTRSTPPCSSERRIQERERGSLCPGGARAGQGSRSWGGSAPSSHPFGPGALRALQTAFEETCSEIRSGPSRLCPLKAIPHSDAETSDVS